MPRVKQLSAAEVYYVNQHRNQSPQEIADTLKIKVIAVNKWLEANPPEPKVAEESPKQPRKLAGFGVSEDRGSVVMTEGQSTRDDAFNKNLPNPKRNNPDLHIINPNEPVEIG
jgi:hypothetical protein